jgi:hypothetical protein
MTTNEMNKSLLRAALSMVSKYEAWGDNEYALEQLSIYKQIVDIVATKIAESEEVEA